MKPNAELIRIICQNTRGWFIFLAKPSRDGQEAFPLGLKD